MHKKFKSKKCLFYSGSILMYPSSVSASIMVRYKDLGVSGWRSWEAWTFNHVVGSSSPSWNKLTKSLQQAFNPKIAGSFWSRPKFGGPVYHNNIVGTLKIHLCPSHIGKVLRLPGAVSLDVLHFASLRITLTVPDYINSSRSGRY